MTTTNQRRFTEAELDWLLSVAPTMTQSAAARKLKVNVQAVNNWAMRHKVKFVGARNRFRPFSIPSKPVQRETQDVDMLMKLTERLKGIAF
jgi:hypothetical protein